MAIVKITPDDVEVFTIATNPIRTYSSSSSGATGSIYVFPRRSPVERDTVASSSFIDAKYDEKDINVTLHTAQSVGRSAFKYLGDVFTGVIDEYLNDVNQTRAPIRKQKVLDIKRFTPSVVFGDETIKKLIIKDNLMPYYRAVYPSAHWAYSNYNCLSFFTASQLSTSSVLLYPNILDGTEVHEGYVSGVYSLSGAFSFDFYINPRYKPDVIDGQFKAGTIFHLSSSYALSLVSGSSRDENGRANAFRLQLQLSHSADIPPSQAVLGSYPNDLVFLSDDNVLLYNTWNHVIVRWGTNLVNKGTGSFNINGIDRGFFVVPSGTITPKLFDNAARDNPDVLCFGNYYEGLNNGTSGQAYFFANDPALRDGLDQLIDDIGGIDEPAHYAFNHPLNADLHDISIKKKYMTDFDIAASASRGPIQIDDQTIFYVPPFFVQSATFRQYVNGIGGILQTPFFEVDGTTDDPFNVAMSFGVAGHYINLENFVKNFANQTFPRLHHLTGVAIMNTTDVRSANDFLYDQPFVRKRNLLVMPCDDGLFVPSFDLLLSESIINKAIDALGVQELSFINLDNLVLSSSLIFQSYEAEGLEATSNQQFVNDAIGFTPEQPGMPTGPAFLTYVNVVNDAIASGTLDAGIQAGAPLTVYQRTRDPSSNQVTMFDMSNLYYGMRIHPKSLVITDQSLSASYGALPITLKDDGYGNLYRADCLTSASTWNSVGNVFYDEGLIVIKSPHLYFFGKDQFAMTFQGEQNIHSLKIEVLAKAGQLNSSSNPNYQALSPTGLPTDRDESFVYITGINFHDKNFNVVAKTQLAQPILKRKNSRLLIKNAIDF